MKSRVMGDLKKVFRPELLNRIDETIVFHKLTKEEIKIIVDLVLKRLREQMSTHETAIELTDDAKDLLVEKGYDPAMGARPLRRAIQRFIEDPLADFVLGRTLAPNSTILVARKNEDEVDITLIPGAPPEPEKVAVPAGEGGDGGEKPEAEEPAERRAAGRDAGRRAHGAYRGIGGGRDRHRGVRRRRLEVSCAARTTRSLAAG